MKKNFKIFIILLAVITFISGCSQNQEEKFADKSFINDISKGLESRWNLISKDEEKNAIQSTELLNKYADAELNEIGKYKDREFEDTILKEKALMYIGLIEKQKEISAYYSVDYNKFLQENSNIYNERSKLLTLFVESYGLTVSTKNQQNLNDFLTNAKLLKEKEAKEEEIEKMIAGIEFNEVSNNSFFKTYQTILENTTHTDFEDLSIIISLIDDQGIIVDTRYCSTSNFKIGAKVQLEFITDKDFASMEISINYWS